jgi:hypothetical protein
MNTWTKAEAASEQIDSAIGQFAEQRFISAHTLTCAGAELAVSIAKHKGRTSHGGSLEEMVKHAAPHRLAEVQRTLRKPQNFAKHADRDPEEEIEVNPRLTETLLFQAVLDVGVAFEKRTWRQLISLSWFSARNPSLLVGDNTAYLAGLTQIFGQIADMPQTDAIRSLKAQLDDLDQPDLRIRFEKALAETQIDWGASLKGMSS